MRYVNNGTVIRNPNGKLELNRGWWGNGCRISFYTNCGLMANINKTLKQQFWFDKKNTGMYYYYDFKHRSNVCLFWMESMTTLLYSTSHKPQQCGKLKFEFPQKFYSAKQPTLEHKIPIFTGYY